MENKKIAVLIGSLRKESLSRKMAKSIISLAPAELDMEIIELGGLQLYNEDLEETLPKEWADFRQRLNAYDGLLFVTPEYNRSVPGVLKNALDVGSRPYGKSIWNGKPAAVVSISRGNMGGFGANHHLRQSLVFLNVPTMQQPEAYIGNVVGLFDGDGNLTNESTKAFLQKFVDAFSNWISRNTFS